MYSRKPIDPTVVFDGHECDLENTFCLNTDAGQTIRFALSDFLPFPIYAFRKRLGEKVFAVLLNEFGWKTGKGIAESVTNATGSEVYFLPDNSSVNPVNYALIVSFGEISPAHFRVTVEAVFEQS